MEKENMQLYSARLYIVKDSVDYFTTKEFIKCRLLSRSGEYLRHQMTTTDNNSIMIGKDKFTTEVIFQKLGDYYRQILKYDCSNQWPYILITKYTKRNVYYEMQKNLEYYDNLLLFVSKQPYHRVQDILTGYEFPELLGNIGYNYYFPDSLKVFETNQRVYANIERELTLEDLEKVLENLTKEELEKRKESLLYILRHAEEHWHPTPEPPSVSDRVLEFITGERKKYSEKKAEKEKKKA